MKDIDKKELHDIFTGIANNNEEYFNKLYEKYKKLIYAIAYSILKNKENSEDIAQKVFIKIWKIEKDKLPKNNEACWLYSITKNETIDFLRNKKSNINIDDLYYISEENEEINKIIEKDSYNKIIEKLDLQEQEIVTLKIISDLTFKEISKLLNIPEGTAKWKYYKAIHTLKLLLSNLGMFVITFIISIKTVFNKKKTQSEVNETIQDNNIEKNETGTTETATSHKENVLYDSIEQEENTIQENVIEQNIITENINNYYKIGILSLSAIFLFFTIFFTIIIIKYQSKRKKHLYNKKD